MEEVLQQAEHDWEELMAARNAATEKMSRTKVDEVRSFHLTILTWQPAARKIRGEDRDEGDVLEARGSPTASLLSHAPTMVLASNLTLLAKLDDTPSPP